MQKPIQPYELHTSFTQNFNRLSVASRDQKQHVMTKLGLFQEEEGGLVLEKSVCGGGRLREEGGRETAVGM